MRRILWSFFGLLILGIGGYSALWFVASGKVISSLQMWKSAERDTGRVWTCGKEKTSGFPLRMILICEKPTLESFGSERLLVAADLLQLEAHVFNPSHISFSVSQKLSLEFQQQVGNLSFEQLGGFIKWTSSSAWELRIEGQNFLFSSEPNNLIQDWNGSRIGSLSLRLSERAAAGTTTRVMAISVELRSVRTAARNVLTVNEGAVDGKIIAQLTHAGMAEGGAYAQLERWRTGGGLLTIIEAAVSANASSIGVSGAFQIDDLHRLAGTGAVKFSDALILTNALKSASSGNFSLRLGADLKPSISPGRPLQAPIMLTNGKVYVGPIDTRLRLYPLY